MVLGLIEAGGLALMWAAWIYGGDNGYGCRRIGKGLIRDGTGFVTFLVKYWCVGFKGEILEAVTMVNKTMNSNSQITLRPLALD
ncbi:hypothetical protein Ddye_007725 [Dipteronia dyeriana]|uniref:Uncharacterized protein n=1 Tax=Dipteronia dyeriana TaxID=168575 RepID=A0AAD9XKS4_9ROSI|nr:hypothetical protein Ddye_007725 [Dipteronia dyeriana]